MPLSAYELEPDISFDPDERAQADKVEIRLAHVELYDTGWVQGMRCPLLKTEA